MKNSALLLIIFLLFGGISRSQGQDKGRIIPCPLDSLLDPPHSWGMTQDAFEENFTDGNNKLFVWLTKDRTRAKISRNKFNNQEIDITAFPSKTPIQEAIIDFVDGKLNLMTVSIYNRGDNGEISTDEFSERFIKTGKALGEIFSASPREKKADSRKGLLTEGFSWYSQKIGLALLEHNEGALEGADREFLRLRVAQPNPKGSLAASMSSNGGTTATKLRDLPVNVAKEGSGDIWIHNLPMVDQGNKGYCVAASAQRVFEYYGIGADMHQIAQIANTDSEKGTSTLLMAKELDKIDYRFKTRLVIIGMGSSSGLTEVDIKNERYLVGDPVEKRDFTKKIKKFIDDGLPLLWALELGRFPEQPQLNPQTSGGHMRIIIGYNDQTEEIIFSDSWGAGHERKKMNMDDAYKATSGLFVLKPTVH